MPNSIPTTAPVSILLVDDDSKNLLALESTLESPEYVLAKARSADEALLELMHGDFAAIVLDVQMPDLSGIELARLIKQRKKTQHIPILFLTAHYRKDEDVVLGYGAGAVDYLTKPYNPAVLRSKIGVFVDLFRKTRALAEMNNELQLQDEERSRRVRAEAAQAEAEAARERLALLAEASSILAGSFNPQETLSDVAQLAIERLADYCAIDIRDEDGHAKTIASAVRSSDATSIARIDTAHRKLAISRVLETGKSAVWPEENPASSTANLDSIQEQAFVIAPLKARGRRLGALKMSRALDRPFSGAEVALIEELAERCGLALDNARLYSATQNAREAAEAANAAKDRFLAMLSHELRTPLSPVLHAVTLLEEDSECPPGIKETLNTIRRNVQLEARLIDDLLDIARIRNGKLQLYLDTADVHDLLQRALKICEADIEARHLKVATSLAAKRFEIQADSARIQQIFWNIIANAIKFTPDGGSLSITTRDDGNESIRVEIRDSGIGIEPSKIEKIFNAFEQVQHQSSRGLGLGLAICKALVSLHGGSIKATSEGAGKGSLFTIILPSISVPHIREEVITPEPAKKLSVPMKLLVVEDHPDTAATLCRLLKRRGFEVRSADSVAAALKAADEYEFDVILSDIGLPDGTGVELFEQLTQSLNRQIYGIALSGFGMEQDLDRSKSVGFSEHLTKPVDFALLEKALAKIGQEIPALK